MPPIDENPTFEPKQPAAKAREPKTRPAATERPASPNLVSLTIDAATGRIVKIEGADAAGARRELSEGQISRLARTEAGATLQSIVEQAFEAGIAYVLGDRAGEEEPPESDDDAELSHLLLQSLIKRSAAERLMQREILARAIVGTLIEQAAGFSAGPSETTATH
jgi:hypothetical protein